MDKNVFQVLLLGKPRCGKSSMLNAMFEAMETMRTETKFDFIPDEDTQTLLSRKSTDLKKIFSVYQKDEEFQTRSGFEGDVDYSPQTSSNRSYRFNLSLSTSSKTQCTVDFLDIMGEYVDSDECNEEVKKSAVILIAIDTPALMEHMTAEGFGFFHEKVNIPCDIHRVISNGCIADDKEIIPKLLLFVPIKCEKYYYAGQMNEVNTAVKKGYKGIFEFMSKHNGRDFSVGITPILTLGDVVFSRYGTQVCADGKERLKNEQWFRFYESNGAPSYRPFFCEQPLCYLVAYILSIKGYIKNMQQKQKMSAKIFRFVRDSVGVAVFGVQYLFYRWSMTLMSDVLYVNQMKYLCRKIMLDTYGYELVIDNLGIRNVVLQEMSNLPQSAPNVARGLTP